MNQLQQWLGDQLEHLADTLRAKPVNRERLKAAIIGVGIATAASTKTGSMSLARRKHIALRHGSWQSWCMKKQPVIDESDYAGQWIALDPDSYEVISHHKVLSRALNDAKRKGIKYPLMHNVPKSDGYFVGGNTIVSA